MPTINKCKKSKPIPYKKDNTYSQYYSTCAWNNLRNYYLHKNPLCENCLKNDIIRPATNVHHKQFLSTKPNDAWDLLLDENNLMSVCNECHHAIHTYANRNNLKYCDYIKIDRSAYN